MRGPNLLLGLLPLLALFFVIQDVSAAGALIPRDLDDSTDAQNFLEARAAKRCTSSRKCGRNSYCSWGRCRRKKWDGDKCHAFASCFSGSCDVQSGRCASRNLSLGTRCSTSASCGSGNCQNAYCAPKKRIGQYCYKSSNCRTGYCNKAQNRCSRVPQEEEQDLQPSLPWNRDLSDLSNLDASPGLELFYLQSGALDTSVSQIFATLKADLSFPAVVLSHSNRVGVPKCEAASVSKTGGAGIEVPFSDAAAYSYAKNSWSKLSDKFLIVTHTDGCGAADKADERTFWLVEKGGLVWDDVARTVDVRCTEVAHQDVINEVDIKFGGSTPDSGSGGSTGGGSTGGNTGGGNTGGGNTGGGSTGGNGGSTAGDAVCQSVTSSTLVRGLPVAACGANFDRTLDDRLGFNNLLNEDTFAEYALELAPGVGTLDPNAYDQADDDFKDDTVYSNSKRQQLRRAELMMYDKRLISMPRWLKKAASGVVTVVTAPARAALKVVTTVVAATPLGPLVDKALEAASPKIDKVLNLSLKPTKGLKASKNFGNQYQIFTDTFDRNGATGYVGLYCVDCGIEGSAQLTGQLQFSIQNGGSIKQAYVQVAGGIKATAVLGLEAEGTYEKTAKANIATVPLGGFAIKDYVVVGPSMSLDAQFKFNAAASGSVKVGATYGMDAFKARLDFLAENAWEASGFTPKFQKVFEVGKTEIKAEAVLSLPVSIGMGIKIKPVSFDKKVAISTEPGIGAEAKYIYDASAPETECNGGIAYEISLRNEVAMDFLGTRKPLGEPWKHKLAGDCYLLPGAPSNGGSTGGEGAGTGNGEGTGTGNGEGTGTGNGEGTGTGNGEGTGTGNGEGTGTGNGEGTGTGSENGEGAGTGTEAGNGNGEGAGTGSEGGEGTGKLEGRAVELQGPAKRATAITTQDDIDLTDSDFDFANDDLSDEAKKELSDDINETMAAAEAAGSQDGFEYIQIQDALQRFKLANNEDGSLTLVEKTAQTGGLYFAAVNNVVVSDESENLFVYYPATMKELGVSRLRMVEPASVPKTSDMLTWVPVNVDDKADTPGIYVPRSLSAESDSAKEAEVFYTMLCNFRDGSASKLFLAKNADTAEATLKSQDALQTVAGGVISACQYLPLMPMSGGFGGF